MCLFMSKGTGLLLVIIKDNDPIYGNKKIRTENEN